MRMLWANYACLLDSSSGASQSVEQMLIEFKNLGHEVRVLGATIFDDEKGTAALRGSWPKLKKYDQGTFVDIQNGDLIHSLLVTESTSRSRLTFFEQQHWVKRYRQELMTYKPEFVFFYGGGICDHIPSEARSFGIPSGAYLVNGTFYEKRWTRDINVFITDTEATRDLYRKRANIDPVPVGKFISTDKISPSSKRRERLLFVNPTIEKGGGIVVLLAHLLSEISPDIEIEVIESRGKWNEIQQVVNTALDIDASFVFPNVKVTQTVSDMSLAYARAKLLIVPSLWWESGARVIAEAQLNGIPVIATDIGGNKEMVGKGGIIFSLPGVCHKAPYSRLPPIEKLRPLAQKIKDLFYNKHTYDQLVKEAKLNAKLKFDAKKNIKLFEKVITSEVRRSAPWHSNEFNRTPPAFKPFDERRSAENEIIHDPLSFGEKGIFIDCGGFDGCSAFKFHVNNTGYDSITFEPNKDLWHFYNDVPTTLVKAAVLDQNGTAKLFLDAIDGDGSTVLKQKFLHYGEKIAARSYEYQTVQTYDISEIIQSMGSYDKIILKLDVEGAEYIILQKLMDDGLLKKVSKLYIEWHWDKIGMNEDDHISFVKKVVKYCPIFDWDALDYQYPSAGIESPVLRSVICRRFLKNDVTAYQGLKLNFVKSS